MGGSGHLADAAEGQGRSSCRAPDVLGTHSAVRYQDSSRYFALSLGNPRGCRRWQGAKAGIYYRRHIQNVKRQYAKVIPKKPAICPTTCPGMARGSRGVIPAQAGIQGGVKTGRAGDVRHSPASGNPGFRGSASAGVTVDGFLRGQDTRCRRRPTSRLTCGERGVKTVPPVPLASCPCCCRSP
jgi:hypothetical protein